MSAILTAFADATTAWQELIEHLRADNAPHGEAARPFFDRIAEAQSIIDATPAFTGTEFFTKFRAALGHAATDDRDFRILWGLDEGDSLPDPDLDRIFQIARDLRSVITVRSRPNASYKERVTEGVLEAIFGVSIVTAADGTRTAALISGEIVDVLISLIAMLIGESDACATPRATRELCEDIASRIRRRALEARRQGTGIQHIQLQETH